MYWGDRDNPRILRANLDGSDVEVIIDQDLESPVGMAIAQDSDKIYFTDRYANKIKRSNKDGSDVEVIVENTKYPTDIVVNSESGKIYWTSRKEGRVYKANMDGSGVYAIVEGLKEPIGIDLDAENGRLFFSEVNLLNGKIYTSDLEGNNLRQVAAARTPLGLIYVPEN